MDFKIQLFLLACIYVCMEIMVIWYTCFLIIAVKTLVVSIDLELLVLCTVNLNYLISWKSWVFCVLVLYNAFLSHNFIAFLLIYEYKYDLAYFDLVLDKHLCVPSHISTLHRQHSSDMARNGCNWLLLHG
jgi:hypothetical protein